MGGGGGTKGTYSHSFLQLQFSISPKFEEKILGLGYGPLATFDSFLFYN